MTYTPAESPEGGSAEALSGLSVEPALDPMDREAGVRAGDVHPEAGSLTFGIRGHQEFEARLNLPGLVTSRSRVFVSICELGVFGGELKPFQGAANMMIHNIVPHDDGTLIVRGFIGWNTDLNARLSVFVA
jgi:hypothetical protein